MGEQHNIPIPNNQEFLQRLLAVTPARIGVWRSGVRPLTKEFLKFRADHAAAQDAVNGMVNEELLAKLDLSIITSEAPNKEVYLTRPDLGRRLSIESIKKLKELRSQGGEGIGQVQLVVSDGLSSQAIEANLEDFLPAFQQGLSYYGLTANPPFFLKYGRVRVLEDIAKVIEAEVYLIIIGERPGLATAESMSAYLVYRPKEDTTDADYLVLSNIHRRGTPTVEAAAQLAKVVKQVIDAKACGIALKQQLQV